MIIRSRLEQFAPNGKPEILAAIVAGQSELDVAGINTPLRIQHFLSQVATETGGLHRLDENLNYSAERLNEVWPKRFPTISSAVPYAHNPEALANRVYRNRLGNGSTSSGDGWRFRGSGMMQNTGRDNFRAAGHENDPETLRQPGSALSSAIKFWTDHRLNAVADRDNVLEIRHVVNGGENGLSEARAYLKTAKRIFV